MTRRGVLTERELDVARLVARGWSNGQIARVLHVAEQTVKNHLASIYGTLGWTRDGGNQRVLLALWWQQHGEKARTNAKNGRIESAQSNGPAPRGYVDTGPDDPICVTRQER